MRADSGENRNLIDVVKKRNLVGWLNLKAADSLLLSCVPVIMKTSQTASEMHKGSSTNTGEYVVEEGETFASDNAALATLGYKQEFKRSFNAIEVFGLGFATIGLIPSIS